MEDPEQYTVQRAVSEAKELIKMLETTSVRRINLEAGEFKIEIEREFTAAPAAPRSPQAAPLPDQAAPGDQPGLHRLLSPMVGTFYRSPSPGAKAFVEVGGRVEKNQTIGIVEAMKVMNEIVSDASGVIVEFLAQDEHPVQYEQPLLVIDTRS